MKYLKLLPTLLALAATGALLSPAAKAQIALDDFANNNLNGWTVLGTNTRVPYGFTGVPLNLGTAPGQVTLVNGTAIIASGPNAGLVASSLSRNFSFNVPNHLGGSGRLQMIGGSVNLSFNWQALSNEGPGAPYDYVRGQLNGQAIVIDELRYSNNNLPGAFGFGRSSAVQSVTLDVTSLSGKTNNLAFFGSDTIDASVTSALALSNVRLTFSHVVLQDVDAINSVYFSGLPTALVQRQLLFNTAFNANRDVNGRLFRLHSEADVRTEGAAGPSGEGKEAKDKKVIVSEERRWSFYATGAYGYRDMNNVDLSAGFQTDLFTATLGAEYKITPALTVGIASSRIEADNDLGALGSANIEGWSYDAYISYAANHFYADLLYALGTYSNHINRNTGFNGTATARPDSLTNSIQFNTGYNISMGRVLTGPIASLNWVHGDIDGYNEQQGGVANLSVPEQHADSLTSELGWQLSVPIHTGFGSITPQVRASWVHEYLNTSKALTVGLQDSPYYALNSTGTSFGHIGSFNATGGTSAAGDDYVSVGAGVGFGIGDRASVILDWETRFFQDHSSAQNVSLTGQIKF